MNSALVKKEAMKLGADIVGIADLDLVDGISTIPDNFLDPYSRAIIIGIAISPDIFELIQNEPTPLYVHHYQTTNSLLDNITLLLQNKLLIHGFKALAIPASQIIDPENQMGQVSHKALARAAGIGWLGKSLLLVTPKYGPRVRLATILTDAPLDTDKPLPNHCGECRKCQEACPANAIKGILWEEHPESREEALYFSKCVEKLTLDFAKRPNIGKSVCGICIKVCPWGRKR